MSSEKLDFASTAWIEEARNVLEDLVPSHGEAGKVFSVCEIFTDAPEQVAPTGTAAWHFYIDGLSVMVGEGIVDNTDVKIKADYQSTLPAARLVYTPEILAKRAAEPVAEPAANESSGSMEGDMSLAPPYLIELHNRLAVLTA